MKHKLTYTDNYILVVDDSEIKFKDMYFNEEDGILLWQDALPAYHKLNSKKIIAHLPLNNSPVLEGVPLLPPMKVEVDALCPYPESMQNAVDWHNGYNKAKEKYRYTEEDVRKAFEDGYLFHAAVGLTDKDSLERQFNDTVQSLSQPKMPTHFEYIDTITTDEGTYPEWIGNYIQEP